MKPITFSLLLLSFLLINCNKNADIASYRGSHIQIGKEYSRYFEKEGHAWIPISINYLPENNMENMEQYFQRFSENGGNSMRIWISTASLEIEDSVEGVYNEEKFRRIDKVLELAKKYDIYIKFTLQHIRSISEKAPSSAGWSNSKALATRFKDIKEYINTPEGRHSYIMRAKALSDRYKNHSHIYGWELWNEMDALANEKEVMDFTSFMLDSIKALFPNTLVTQTLGSLHSEIADHNYRSLAKITKNDFLSIHRYLDEGSDWGQYDIIKGAIDVLTSNAIYFGNELTKNNPIPVVMNEIGAVEPSHSGPFRHYKKDRQGILIHDMIFAPFFSGSAGSGSMWHWNHYIYPQDLWSHFKRFENIIHDVDPVKEKFTPSYFEKDGVKCYILNGKKKTMIWCRDGTNNWKTELEDEIPAKPKENFAITLNELSLKKVNKVSLYDPWQDKWDNTIHVLDNKIDVPPFLRSVVIILE